MKESYTVEEYRASINSKNPETKTKKLIRHKESDIQTACVRWFRTQYPEFLIFAVPNGGFRNPREAARLIKEGVTPGIPDLCIPVVRNGHAGLFIEMKAENNKPRPNQIKCISKLKKEGYRVEVVNSIEIFISLIKEYIG